MISVIFSWATQEVKGTFWLIPSGSQMLFIINLEIHENLMANLLGNIYFYSKIKVDIIDMFKEDIFTYLSNIKICVTKWSFLSINDPYIQSYSTKILPVQRTVFEYFLKKFAFIAKRYMETCSEYVRGKSSFI